MSEKEKELLSKDLCGRLSSEVKGRVFAETSNGEFDIMGDMIFNDEPFDVVLDGINVGNGEIRVTAIKDEETCDFIDSVQDCEPYTIETFKPYLRPMSSMTEREKGDLWFLLSEGRTNIELTPEGRLTTIDDAKLGFNYPYVCPQGSSEYIDWLNAHHFDYRGLIKKGLALEAPEGMYALYANEK